MLTPQREVSSPAYFGQVSMCRDFQSSFSSPYLDYDYIFYPISMRSASIGKVYLLLVIAKMVCSGAVPTPGDCGDYEAFLSNCSRLPDSNPTTYQQRKAAYTLNCQTAIDQNQKYDRNQSSFHLRLYCNTADVPQGQQGSLLGLRTYSVSPQGVAFTFSPNTTLNASSLPSSLNYVQKGWVTSVKDQGSCGSCWSFAGIAMYESQLLKRGFSYGLSQQAALECTSYYAPNQRENSCQGGYVPDTLTFLGTVGSVLRSSYPYTAGSYSQKTGYPRIPGICSETNRIMVGSGTGKTYIHMTILQLKTLLNEFGPVMVGIYANWGFMFYAGGVFSGCPSYSYVALNHAVLLVGYDDATGSWLIKNQWGTDWGESGYIRLAYNKDCGLSSLAGVIEFSNENADPKVTVSPQLLRGSHQDYSGVLALLLMVLILTI